MSKEYLKLKNVRKVYKSKGMGKEVKETIAVNDISLDIYKAETLAVVGESGSGKTTLGKGILNIDPFISGDVFVEGNEKSLTKMSKKELAEVYSKMQIIFQDPYSSLNPRMSALDIVMEALHKEDKVTAKKKALEILEFVGISNEDALKLSNAFSGGQRQRIGIARAVVTKPDFILMVIKIVLLSNLILILFKLDTLQITLSLNLLPLTELNALTMRGTMPLNTSKVFMEEPTIPVVKWRKMLTEILNFIVIKPTIITNNTTNCFGINT